MEIFRIENKKNNVFCRECNQILKFNINHERFEVEGICKNRHIFNNISFKYFIDNYILYSSSKTFNCCKCFTNNENNIFLCQCDKIFCSNCIKSHLKEEKHRIKKYKNEINICDVHKKANKFFCDFCKLDICENCKINHQNHYIKSIADILPSKKLKESFPQNAENFKEKILLLKESIKEEKKEIDQRFEKLNLFFDFIVNLNEKLFQKYNFEIDDFNNYENINYINRYINNKKIIEEKTYLNYLLFNQKIDIGEKMIIPNKINNGKIKTNKKIPPYCDYNNLKIFKENLFYEIKNQDQREKYIKIFELKDYLFKYITYYDLNQFKQIHSIKLANYGNYFLINLGKKKNIKILEYDIGLKTLSLSGKEVKSNKIYFGDRNFNDFIDDKNGNILTIDYDSLIVWKKNQKKKYFNEIISFPYQYNKLYNINEKLFFGKYSNKITFFKYDKYEIIQLIQYNGEIEYACELNENILILKNMNKYVLISLKYFEIQQIIDFGQNNCFLKAKDNILIQYSIKNKQIKIIKSLFNEKEGCFNKEENISINTNITTNNPNILLLNNNNIFIGESGLMIIYTKVI